MRPMRLLLLGGFLHLTGCQTYKYAENVKLVSFSDDFSEGKSIGNVQGEDCLSTILGYDLGPAPTLDRAMLRAQTQAAQGMMDNVVGSNKGGDLAIRYMNSVTTTWEGFNAYVFQKRCLVVKGRGYK